MTANVPAAERLARAVAESGIPLDSETAAGLLSIGTALLRTHGLSREDVLTLASMFYDATPDIAREAVAKAGRK